MYLSFFEARFGGISNLLANPGNEILDTTGITREYLMEILTTFSVPRYANRVGIVFSKLQGANI